jgi:hypothetical protein
MKPPGVTMAHGSGKSLQYAASPPAESHGRRGTVAIGLGIAGVMLGLICLFLAFLMSGAGHGWGAAAGPSLVAPIGGAATGVAWAFRHSAGGKLLASALVIVAVITDIFLVLMTSAEGVEYVQKVWSAAPAVVVAWTVTWLGWQVSAVLSLLHGPRRDRAAADPDAL